MSGNKRGKMKERGRKWMKMGGCKREVEKGRKNGKEISHRKRERQREDKERKEHSGKKRRIRGEHDERGKDEEKAEEDVIKPDTKKI